LDASNYGVPQKRERVFIVGVLKSINRSFVFPIESPTKKVLKDVLFKWYVFHQNQERFEVREEQRRDFFAELESKYVSLFRGHSFKGFAPKMRFD
jgi:site-specific DNA-cytosine methylase